MLADCHDGFATGAGTECLCRAEETEARVPVGLQNPLSQLQSRYVTDACLHAIERKATLMELLSNAEGLRLCQRPSPIALLQLQDR